MSNASTDAPGKRPRTPRSPADTVKVVGEEARFGAAFLRAYGGRLLLVFAGVLAPLWGFGELVETLRAGEAFFFDVPLLERIHSLAGNGLDRAFLLITQAGYAWGVVPLDVALVIGLALCRRMREGLFAGVSIIGSMLLNIAAKHSFARARPDLWESIRPETTFSFPSGHAMGSMTLAMVLVLLCWSVRTPWGWGWRWPVTVLASVFVLLVGVSRIYLGVHYPSDILAGWAAASVWVVGVYGLVFYGSLRPWQPRAAKPR